MPLRYTDLFKIWLQTQKEQRPEGMAGIGNATWQTPENMVAYLNSRSPYDLYMRPDYTAPMTDYPTTAFNIGDITQPEKDAVIFASREPRSRLTPIYPVTSEESERQYTDIPKNKRYLRSRSIYEHEKEHQRDYRMPIFSRDIETREAPAMTAEDRFWDMILNFNRK